MKKEQIEKVYDSKFIKMYDLQYEEGRHYMVASRHDVDDLPALAKKEDYATMLPDAVSCIVVIDVEGEEPKLLLSKEFRYPAGQYLLSVPAGLIDEEDKKYMDALERTAIRELKEETGITFEPWDEIRVVNPFVFSTPGMTDEANALVYMRIKRDTMPSLSQDGAVGSEKFNGFELLTKEDAENLLCSGRDQEGIYYPIWSWAAMMFFMGV
ncbi:MAG: NUDIX hydrolase [Eubacteriales bacterium]|nr:NUDIX hydrolase [Eubacteriales bacterium]